MTQSLNIVITDSKYKADLFSFNKHCLLAHNSTTHKEFDKYISDNMDANVVYISIPRRYAFNIVHLIDSNDILSSGKFDIVLLRDNESISVSRKIGEHIDSNAIKVYFGLITDYLEDFMSFKPITDMLGCKIGYKLFPCDIRRLENEIRDVYKTKYYFKLNIFYDIRSTTKHIDGSIYNIYAIRGIKQQ